MLRLLALCTCAPFVAAYHAGAGLAPKSAIGAKRAGVAQMPIFDFGTANFKRPEGSEKGVPILNPSGFTPYGRKENELNSGEPVNINPAAVAVVLSSFALPLFAIFAIAFAAPGNQLPFNFLDGFYPPRIAELQRVADRNAKITAEKEAAKKAEADKKVAAEMEAVRAAAEKEKAEAAAKASAAKDSAKAAAAEKAAAAKAAGEKAAAEKAAAAKAAAVKAPAAKAAPAATTQGASPPRPQLAKAGTGYCSNGCR